MWVLKQISRVTRTKEEAKASYDQQSKWYERLTGPFERKFKLKGLQELDVKEGEIVLEIGFGPGQCLVLIAESVGEKGKVYGIDISEGMYNQAKLKLSKAGLQKRVKLELGDATKLPYESSFFDSIYMSFVLELFDTPEIPVVLKDCIRVLKKGGRIGVVSLLKKENSNIVVKLYEWFHNRFPKYVDCRPIYVHEALEKADFKIQKTLEMSMWGLPVEVVIAEKIK